MIRANAWIVLAVLSTLCFLSCAPKHRDLIVVGSKNFTESFILGEIIAQQIEQHTKLKVERRFYLAGTYICQQAILSGRIDIYPEYTALTAVLKQKASSDRNEVYHQVKSEYETRFGLTLGVPFGFNDTFAMEIRGEDARRLNVKTLSQAAAYARSGMRALATNSWNGQMGTAVWPKLTACISPNSLESWIWVCWRVPSRIIRLTLRVGMPRTG